MDDDHVLLGSSPLDSLDDPRPGSAHPLHAIQDYAIVTLSPDGIILTWNAGAETMTGYLSRDMIGHSLACLYTEADTGAGKPQALLHEAATKGRWRTKAGGCAATGQKSGSSR